MNQPLLEYREVDVRYGDEPAVECASLSIAPGRTLALVGESGSGKSTMLKAALGLLDSRTSKASGRILYAGSDLLSLGADEAMRLRRDDFGVVFQDSLASLCPTRSIRAHFEDMLHARPCCDAAQTTERFESLLDRFGIVDSARVLAGYPFELSGGMAQRVGIALALAFSPKILFADEPTSALDAISQKRVAMKLRELQKETGMTVVLVTHNMGLARVLADQVAVMLRGRVVECQPTERLMAEPRTAYARELLEAVPTVERGQA